METFKLSCPRCGQHIEYTKDYCGRQVQCPSCAGGVTFPALPPGAVTQKLHLERDGPKVKEPFRFDLRKILGSTVSFVRNFQHWQIVLMCMVPFALIIVALAIATALRQHDQQTDTSKPVVTETRKAETQQIDAMLKSDAIVRDRLNSVWATKRALDSAISNRARMNHNDGRPMTAATRAAVAAADDRVQTAQANLAAWLKTFDTAYDAYQKAGGKVDYRSQLPR